MYMTLETLFQGLEYPTLTDATYEAINKQTSTKVKLQLCHVLILLLMNDIY